MKTVTTFFLFGAFFAAGMWKNVVLQFSV